MNERPRTALEDFRRWMLMVIGAAVVGGGANFLIGMIVGFPGVGMLTMAYASLWALFGLAEGRLLFEHWSRRLLWAIVSATTVALVIGANSAMQFGVVAAGASEAALCVRVRRYPWAWILVTPTLYLTVDTWSSWCDTLTSWVQDAAREAAPVLQSVDGEQGMFAAAILVLLSARAATACFVCRARLPHGTAL